MSTPLQRMMQMLPQIEQIKNQRAGLALDREQFGLAQQQEERMRATQEIQNKILKANTIMGAAQQAAGLPEEQRKIVAENYGSLVDFVPPEVMAKMMGAAQDNATLTNDKRAAADFKLYQKVLPRIEEGVSKIPDPAIQDMVMGYVSQAFAKTDPGSARTSATIADRKAVADPQMAQAIQQQLNLMMSPEEQADYGLRKQNIAQGWKSLSDNKDLRLLDLNLQQKELEWRLLNMQKPSGSSVGELSPTKAIENLVSVHKMFNDKEQTPEGRISGAIVMRSSLKGLYDHAIAMRDDIGAAQIKELLDMDISKIGPASAARKLQAFLIGGGGMRNVGSGIPAPTVDTTGTPPRSRP